MLQMTSIEVHQVVEEAFDKYEREIAGPRHEAVTGKLDRLLSIATKVQGGVTAIKYVLRYLGGALAGTCALVKILQAWKGH